MKLPSACKTKYIFLAGILVAALFSRLRQSGIVPGDYTLLVR